MEPNQKSGYVHYSRNACTCWGCLLLCWCRKCRHLEPMQTGVAVGTVYALISVALRVANISHF